jgi:prolipoprotein diacylglyceryltransferase
MIHVDERNWQWVYSATALIGLLGAAIGAKLAFLAGDLAWPVQHVTWQEVLFSGRSITGGLLGGFLCAELGKVAIGYRELPNDWFATKLPLSIGIGRVGCVFAGCCRGVAGDYPGAFVYSDGVARFPAQAVELGFQVVSFALAVVAFRRGALRGRIFAVYMIAYGVFRAVLEGVRDTRKMPAGPSVYQVLAVLLAVAGALSYAWYSRAAKREGHA